MIYCETRIPKQRLLVCSSWYFCLLLTVDPKRRAVGPSQAAMLSAENALFEQQLDGLEEKPEARKARMQARAPSLSPGTARIFMKSQHEERCRDFPGGWR